MSASKYTYSLEAQHPDGKWTAFARGMSLHEARGYVWCHRSTPGPRLQVRAVRSDGRVVEESSALAAVGLGMIAGWPSPEQYVAAATRALRSAVDARRMSARTGRADRPWDETDSEAALDACRQALADAEVAP